MSSFENRVNSIRDCLNNQKINLYPIENDELEEKDEYLKSLYLRMLCVLMRYGGELSEMQVNYVNRLIIGIKAEEKFQAYLKMALDISTVDVDNFIDVFREDDLKYYFCIDSCILLSLEKRDEKCYELLAELVEMLGITQCELEYLVKVAKAVITQSSELFNEAKIGVPVTLECISMETYVKSFYTGAIVNNKNLLYIYSHNKSEIDLSKYMPITAKFVWIENIKVNLVQNISFKNCEDVQFFNVDVTLNNYELKFDNVIDVTISDSVFENGIKAPICFNNCFKVSIGSCLFSDFKSKTIQEENVKQLTINDSTFERCDYHYYRGNSDWSSFGCVIYSNSPYSNGINYFDGCSFSHCGGHNETCYYSSDFISNCRSQLSNCTFKNCWHFNSGNIDPERESRRMFTCDSKAIDCKVINSAKIN